MKRIKKHGIPSKILIITLRHLGDVHLTTPLISSLNQAYPESEIHVLVFHNTKFVLKNNPDINKIITISNKPNRIEYKELLKNIFRKYDLAVTCQTGDRPFFISLLSSPQRVGVVPIKGDQGWLKRYFYHGWCEYDNKDTHTVLQMLKIMDVLNKEKVFDSTPPTSMDGGIDKRLLNDPCGYAVVHLSPRYRYKQWTLKGWKEVVLHLIKKGVQVILTGSNSPDEKKYVNQLYECVPKEVVNLVGKTTLEELSDLIKNSLVFIGPDTGVTHLASSTGVPTVSIFGPTNPVKWAPWPSKYQSSHNPFVRVGDQNVNNVFLIQGKGECVPCHQEGCSRNQDSRSDCLDDLPPEEVIRVIDLIIDSY